MIFSIQRFLEDYFAQRGYRDIDQYAVRLANLYVSNRRSSDSDAFLNAARRVRTVFFANNKRLERRSFEQRLLETLNRKFQKKSNDSGNQEYPGGIARERAHFRRQKRRSIESLLNSFQRATEARAVDTLWASRSEGRLRSRPEKVAQGLLSAFILGVLSQSGGLLLRELASGVGFVDVAVVFSTSPHLIEVKILRNSFSGIAQLARYMQTEGRAEGWLVVFDARRQDRRVERIPKKLKIPEGTVRVICIDVNPVVPSRQ